MKKKRIIISMLTLLCSCTGAWAENDWDIQESTSGNVTTFTIIRTNTAAAERVKYRLVNLSAYAGEHYNVTQVNGQNSSALSGDLTFSAGDGSKTVQVTESEASTNAYKYQNGTTRQYRFEVTDQGGFELEHHDRTITTGISVPSSDVFAIKDVTINSDEITVTDGGFGQAYHSMTVSDYFDNAAPRTYLQHIGAELRMTLSFQGREVEDGWQYVQIYANESTSNIDTGAKDGNPGACTYSKYTAAFEILDGEKDANYKSYTFPVTSAGENVKVINPWGHGYLYNLDMQKFNNSRASDGRLIIPTNLLSLYIRFNAYGSGNDDWIAKNTIAHIQAVDGTAPSIQAASADPGYHATGNTVYVSVAFNEIVKVTGTPTLNTSNWGSLNYVSGDGTNVLTFSGVIPENASDNLDITEISGTVKDLAGNDFTGSSVTPSDPYTGSFTIDANGTKVLFSKGNLQYVNGKWQFAEHQYDYFGAAQSDDHKDLFGYNGYSTPDASWFNMSHAQWKYLLATRSVTNSLYAGARYTMATLDGTYKGLIIFPDDYTHPDGTDFVAGTYNGYSNFTATVSLAGWALMEAAGCVFLPAAGYKSYANGFGGFGEAVEINTTTSYNDDNFYTPVFKSSTLNYDDKSYKQSWIPVRLVQLKTNLQKDADGYYLIGSVQDWKDFAALVEIIPKANAKMTADIDLGDDQTHISGTWKGESSPEHYGGIFDGQGHTLTVNYNDDKYFKAPFGHCYGATIKNLHVAGYIYARSQNPHTAGVMCNSTGNDLVQNVWVSATINTNSDAAGAFIGLNNSGASTIRDCLFTGTITTVNSTGGDGCFLGRVRYGSSNIINCLSTGTFGYYGSGSFDGTHTNCYVKQFDGEIPTGMQLTDAQLTDGTIAYKLQAGRTDMVWGQRIGTDPEPLQTNNESYRVYRSKNGGYTNDPTLAYEGLQQDADDNYYLIGSLFDWQEFADLVKTTPTANAKMTADINLGDDQTMIGSESTPYQGLFDGQGHTLTVAYSVTSSSSQHVAPFIKIKNATIQNLHVSGSITTAGMRPASITSYVSGTCYVRNCWSDVAITSSYNADICAGGLVTRIDTEQTLHMDDCKFSGSITLSNNSGYRAGGLIGWTQNNGIAKVTNCLFAPSALSTIKSSDDNKMLVSGYQGKVTITNCYYNTVGASSNWVVQGTAATDAELSNGTTTTALNNDRTGDDAPWVQQGNQPMLATFANAVTLTDVNDLTALSAYAGKTCKVTYSRSFTEAKSSTVCLPFAFAKGSVGTFYTFTGITKSGSEYIATMTVYPGDNLVANTPYLFTPSATGDVDFSGTYEIPASITAGSTTSGNWKYLGTYETISWTTAPTGIYGFSAQAVEEQGISQGEFVKVGAYVRIKPMRCYLEYTGSDSQWAGARGMTRAADEELPETIKVRLIGADGEVTAIGSLQTKTGEVTFDKDAWYSLDGRRIEGKPTAKGIYVNNGKKIVVK